MALRCLLVSLVASLGFELPSGQAVTAWTTSGGDWISARTVDLSAIGAEASGWLGSNDPTMKPRTEVLVATPAPSPTGNDESSPPSTDLAFASINDGMARAFADDSQTALAEPVPVALAQEGSPATPVEVLPQPAADSLALAFPALATAATDEEGDDSAASPPASVDRLSSAVRLTRDAVEAWASLVQSVGYESILTR